MLENSFPGFGMGLARYRLGRAGGGRLSIGLGRWIERAQHLLLRFLRPMTVGVRGVVIDPQNRVLLVRHSYVPGWYLPGGGVEVGETVHDALERELLEEASVVLTGAPQLHGVFLNSRASRRDHVVCFVVRDFRMDIPKQADWEIVETRFFPVTTLPDGTTPATRSRIAEVVDGRAVVPTW